ncbi:MAG: hypothetical protein BHW00_02120 [Clostridium sp. 26_22]|nr:MAG: hypothetical protein BHW00_02120 [Clostridium sp. 26_22]
MKGKIAVAIGIIVFILFLYGIYYLLVIQNSEYYTQIDNSKVESLSTTDNMKYQYTLTAYDEKGKKKEVTFKTNRELREDAYLKLEVMLTRGVTNWEEVQFDEMPKEVQEKYK